jgi:AraC family transcriptional regulator
VDQLVNKFKAEQINCITDGFTSLQLSLHLKTSMTTIYIKNMVCDRCKTAVIRELVKRRIAFQKVELGEVMIDGKTSDKKLLAFKRDIEVLGFELIDNKKSRVTEKIKAEVIRTVYNYSHKSKTNFSLHLADVMSKDYSSLSALFSEVEGTTIEQYAILQKIERAKELLVYDEYSLGQIADQLHYSSIQHLSNQFKKVTGLTPSDFKKLRHHTRKPLDRV